MCLYFQDRQKCCVTTKLLLFPLQYSTFSRQEYYECLEQANDGDIRPFIRFIARCTERTLDEYLWATEEESKLTERLIMTFNPAYVIKS